MRQLRWNYKHPDKAISYVVVIDYPNVDDWLDVQCKQTRIKPSTFFYGFWNPETQTFNLDPFIDADIEKMVFERAVEVLKDSNYLMEDISDTTKSKMKVCKIAWDD